jgi:gliding-associated putative ABC transporter substrate-binding component GldG
MKLNQKNIWLSTIVLVAIVFVLNLILQGNFLRMDLTETGKYSISDVTEEVLLEIDDPVLVKIYYSEKFPRQLIAVKQYVMDILDEYRAYAGNRLEYEFIEITGEDKEVEQEAIRLGVQPVQANITESDEIKVQRIFLGIVFLYGDEKEVIPFAQNIDQLEYDMTGAIKKLIAESTPKVGWLTGHGEPELFGNQGLQKALGEIRKNYELSPVNLKTVNKIDSDLELLILMSPSEEFAAAELYKLDQYIMAGGKLAVFAGTKNIDLQNQFMPVQDNPQNLNDLFRSYGFSIDDRLLMDRQSYQVQAMQSLGPIQIPVSVDYPYAPRLTNFNTDNPIVSRLTEVGFFFANQINSQLDSNDTSVRFTELVRTSEKTGYAMPDPRTRMINIQVNTEMPDFMFREKNRPVAALIEGSFQSHFGPVKPDSILFTETHIGQSIAEGKIIVVGSGTLSNPQFMVPTTMTFLLNTIDWLYDENGLISIRSKDINPKQLEETDAATKAIIKWLNILLAPALVVLFGLIRSFTRRKAKKLAGGNA